MRECWVMYWLERHEGETEEHTAIMTGNGSVPPHPKDVTGKFKTHDLAFGDMVLHVHWHQRIPKKTALIMARTHYKNGDIGAGEST